MSQVVRQETTLSVCDYYTAAVYEKMKYDKVRNHGYLYGIEQINCMSPTNSVWLDLGCGQFLVLSLMVVAETKSMVYAFEVNKKAADYATRKAKNMTFEPGAGIQVFTGASTDPAVMEKFKCKLKTLNFPDVNVIFELFGHIASSEGVWHTMLKLKQSLSNTKCTFVPAICSTLATPVYVHGTPAGKLVLLPLSRSLHECKFDRLSQGMLRFELINFNDPLHIYEKSGVQENILDFSVHCKGEFNALGCFIRVDIDVNSDETTKSIILSEQPTQHATQPSFMRSSRNMLAPVKHFSNIPGDMHVANNWMNAMVMLEHPVAVEKGDRIIVNSYVNIMSELPTYRFDIQVMSGDSLSKQTCKISTNDLFPPV
jgi:hypothetical protein